MEIHGTETVVVAAAAVAGAAEVAAIVEACEVPTGASGCFVPVEFVVLGTPSLALDFDRKAVLDASVEKSSRGPVAVEIPLVETCRSNIQMEYSGMLSSAVEFGTVE